MVQVSTVLSLFLLLICLVDSSSEPKRTMIRKGVQWEKQDEMWILGECEDKEKSGTKNDI
ncbi:uncharacterized protein CELE_C01B10.7 [Caenorhabditis elegans]|uniref:Secreted protein n=1 Tax=Caenorhabditis elegans TaxID=6239 RepID=V6CL84_CAEEL|nr:Secreted protein [Caenorhabditis elegans]CDK13356.1 Secreted protein [Caenorhabditis elegans]|eukprot:NP_001293704.1 Uncharacterized protein CELE_C01B10.7 [Caenorhabditis elegans]